MGGVTIRREIQLLSQRPPATKSSSPGRRTPSVARNGTLHRPRGRLSLIRLRLNCATAMSSHLGRLLGKFEGKTVLESRGVLCGTSMILYSDAAQNGQVVAFVTLQRIDPMAMYSAPKGRAAIRGLVRGIARPNIAGQLCAHWTTAGRRRCPAQGSTRRGKALQCVMTTGTLTPFGYHQILFQWEEGPAGKPI